MVTMTTNTSTKAVAKSLPTFTLKQAREGFGDLDEAVRTVAAEKAAHDKIAGHLMWNAGLLAYNVLDLNRKDYVGKGKAFETQEEYVKACGWTSKGYATTLKRLGRAAVVHGVKRTSAEWTFLASHAQRGEVGKAIALDDSEEFAKSIKSLAAQMAEHGSITAGAKPARPNDGTSEGTEGTEEKPEPARVATLNDILDGLDAALKVADKDATLAAITRLNRMIERETRLIAKAEKDAAALKS
jgi:hypothetical protein